MKNKEELKMGVQKMGNTLIASALGIFAVLALPWLMLIIAPFGAIAFAIGYLGFLVYSKANEKQKARIQWRDAYVDKGRGLARLDSLAH